MKTTTKKKTKKINTKKKSKLTTSEKIIKQKKKVKPINTMSIAELERRTTNIQSKFWTTLIGISEVCDMDNTFLPYLLHILLYDQIVYNQHTTPYFKKLFEEYDRHPEYKEKFHLRNDGLSLEEPKIYMWRQELIEIIKEAVVTSGYGKFESKFHKFYRKIKEDSNG
jgi:hypothetical protein